MGGMAIGRRGRLMRGKWCIQLYARLADASTAACGSFALVEAAVQAGSPSCRMPTDASDCGEHDAAMTLLYLFSALCPSGLLCCLFPFLTPPSRI